jgi:hypothetical protein
VRETLFNQEQAPGVNPSEGENRRTPREQQPGSLQRL